MKWVEFLVQEISWKIKYHKSYPMCISFNHLVSHVTFTFHCPPTYGDTLELPLMWCFFFNLKSVILLTLFSRSWYIHIQFFGFECLANFSKFLVIFFYKKNPICSVTIFPKKVFLEICIVNIEKKKIGLTLIFLFFYINNLYLVCWLLVLYNGFWECVCVCKSQ
jgi:hypothetical protein